MKNIRCDDKNILLRQKGVQNQNYLSIYMIQRYSTIFKIVTIKKFWNLNLEVSQDTLHWRIY